MKFSIKDFFSKYEQVRMSITEVGNIVDSWMILDDFVLVQHVFLKNIAIIAM